jgi:hypothetical protein
MNVVISGRNLCEPTRGHTNTFASSLFLWPILLPSGWLTSVCCRQYNKKAFRKILANKDPIQEKHSTHSHKNVPLSRLLYEICCLLTDMDLVTFSVAFHSRCRVYSLYIRMRWKLRKRTIDQKNLERRYQNATRLYTYITKQLESCFLTTQHTSCSWAGVQSYTKG